MPACTWAGSESCKVQNRVKKAKKKQKTTYLYGGELGEGRPSCTAGRKWAGGRGGEVKPRHCRRGRERAVLALLCSQLACRERERWWPAEVSGQMEEEERHCLGTAEGAGKGQC